MAFNLIMVSYSCRFAYSEGVRPPVFFMIASYRASKDTSPEYSPGAAQERANSLSMPISNRKSGDTLFNSSIFP